MNPTSSPSPSSPSFFSPIPSSSSTFLLFLVILLALPLEGLLFAALLIGGDFLLEVLLGIFLLFFLDPGLFTGHELLGVLVQRLLFIFLFVPFGQPLHVPDSLLEVLLGFLGLVLIGLLRDDLYFFVVSIGIGSLVLNLLESVVVLVVVHVLLLVVHNFVFFFGMLLAVEFGLLEDVGHDVRIERCVLLFEFLFHLPLLLLFILEDLFFLGLFLGLFFKLLLLDFLIDFFLHKGHQKLPVFLVVGLGLDEVALARDGLVIFGKIL